MVGVKEKTPTILYPSISEGELTPAEIFPLDRVD